MSELSEIVKLAEEGIRYLRKSDSSPVTKIDVITAYELIRRLASEIDRRDRSSLFRLTPVDQV